MLIAVERGDVQLADLPDEEPAISVITVSELLHGVHRASGRVRSRRLAAIERLLEPFEPIPINDAVARVHALVWSELEQSGSVIGGHDLWIGATALTHGLGVATRNPRDFERIPGLRVVAA